MATRKIKKSIPVKKSQTPPPPRKGGSQEPPAKSSASTAKAKIQKAASKALDKTKESAKKAVGAIAKKLQTKKSSKVSAPPAGKSKSKSTSASASEPKSKLKPKPMPAPQKTATKKAKQSKAIESKKTATRRPVSSKPAEETTASKAGTKARATREKTKPTRPSLSTTKRRIVSTAKPADIREEQQVVLMPRDTDSLFVYWTAKPQELQVAEAKKQPFMTYRPGLRLGFEDSPENKAVFQEVSWEHGKAYVPRPEGGGKLQAHLGLLGDKGHFIPVAGSNPVHLPEPWGSTFNRYETASAPFWAVMGSPAQFLKGGASGAPSSSGHYPKGWEISAIHVFSHSSGEISSWMMAASGAWRGHYASSGAFAWSGSGVGLGGAGELGGGSRQRKAAFGVGGSGFRAGGVPSSGKAAVLSSWVGVGRMLSSWAGAERLPTSWKGIQLPGSAGMRSFSSWKLQSSWALPSSGLRGILSSRVGLPTSKGASQGPFSSRGGLPSSGGFGLPSSFSSRGGLPSSSSAKLPEPSGPAYDRLDPSSESWGNHPGTISEQPREKSTSQYGGSNRPTTLKLFPNLPVSSDMKVTLDGQEVPRQEDGAIQVALGRPGLSELRFELIFSNGRREDWVVRLEASST